MDYSDDENGLAFTSDLARTVDPEPDFHDKVARFAEDTGEPLFYEPSSRTGIQYSQDLIDRVRVLTTSW